MPGLTNHAPILIMLTDGEPTEGKHLRAALGGTDLFITEGI